MKQEIQKALQIVLWNKHLAACTCLHSTWHSQRHFYLQDVTKHGKNGGKSEHRLLYLRLGFFHPGQLIKSARPMQPVKSN